MTDKQIAFRKPGLVYSKNNDRGNFSQWSVSAPPDEARESDSVLLSGTAAELLGNGEHLTRVCLAVGAHWDFVC